MALTSQRATRGREILSAFLFADLNANRPRDARSFLTVASQLESGILVTRNGDGHTAYNKGNPCVDATVESYLVDGVVPPADVTC